MLTFIEINLNPFGSIAPIVAAMWSFPLSFFTFLFVFTLNRIFDETHFSAFLFLSL